LADRRANAVRAGVAAADDNDFFAGREDRLTADLRLVAYATILLRQEIHRVMNAGKLAAGNRADRAAFSLPPVSTIGSRAACTTCLPGR
jgi:hypothetical protein